MFRRVLEAWNRRDDDLGRRYLAPEIEWRTASPAVVEGEVYLGYEEVARAAARLWETWEVFRFEESEIRDLGDSLVWLGHVHLKGSASQVELGQEFGIHSLVFGGKIARSEAFLSWREALEAAGLPEWSNPRSRCARKNGKQALRSESCGSGYARVAKGGCGPVPPTRRSRTRGRME